MKKEISPKLVAQLVSITEDALKYAKFELMEIEVEEGIKSIARYIQKNNLIPITNINRDGHWSFRRVCVFLDCPYKNLPNYYEEGLIEKCAEEHPHYIKTFTTYDIALTCYTLKMEEEQFKDFIVKDDKIICRHLVVEEY
jgi:hypothetical protein